MMDVDHTLAVARVSVCLSLVANTIATPDSYDLALRLGGGSAFSGSIVGTCATGYFVGTTCLWLVGRRWPYFWRDVPRLVHLIGVVLGLVGSALYTVVCVAAGDAAEVPVPLLLSGTSESVSASDAAQLDPPQLLGLTSDVLRVILIVAQLFYGMQAACYINVSMQLIANITASADRPYYSGLQTEFAMTGLGLGPVAAGVAHTCANLVWNTPTRHFVAVGIARMFLVVFTGVFLSICKLPDLASFKNEDGPHGTKDTEFQEDAEGRPLKNRSAPELVEPGRGDLQSVEDSAAGFTSRLRLPPWHIQIRFYGVLLIACLLHFGASGLEVASVMVLEVEFGWNPSRAGFVTGITFLAGIPLRRLLNKATGTGNSEAKTVATIRLLLAINALSCVLLFRQLCLMLGSGAWSELLCIIALLMADLLFYSSVMFAQALIRGMAMQCAQAPGEGLLDATNFIFFWAVMVDLIARTTGAPFARARLSSAAGRDGYALQQLVILGVAWVFAEAMVLRRFDSNRDDDFKGQQHKGYHKTPSQVGNEDEGVLEDCEESTAAAPCNQNVNSETRKCMNPLEPSVVIGKADLSPEPRPAGFSQSRWDSRDG